MTARNFVPRRCRTPRRHRFKLGAKRAAAAACKTKAERAPNGFPAVGWDTPTYCPDKVSLDGPASFSV